MGFWASKRSLGQSGTNAGKTSPRLPKAAARSSAIPASTATASAEMTASVATAASAGSGSASSMDGAARGELRDFIKRAMEKSLIKGDTWEAVNSQEKYMFF